jgi:hypothetical protein
MALLSKALLKLEEGSGALNHFLIASTSPVSRQVPLEKVLNYGSNLTPILIYICSKVIIMMELWVIKHKVMSLIESTNQHSTI